MWRGVLFVSYFLLVRVWAHQHGTLRHSSGAPPFMLTQMANECNCLLTDACTCLAAMEFMNCIKDRCESGSCNCYADEVDHYFSSCSAVAKRCPAIGLECWPGKVVCKPQEPGMASINTTSAGMVSKSEYDDIKEDAIRFTHHVFARGMLAAMLVLSVTFAMAGNKNKKLAASAWSEIQTVVLSFLGVTWFYVISGFVRAASTKANFGAFAWVVYAIALLFVYMTIGYKLKSNHDTESEAIFTAIFYWVLLNAKSGAISAVQKYVSYSFFLITLATFGSLLVYAALTFISHHFTARKRWFDATEAALYSGAFAAGLNLWVDYLIHGEFTPFEGGKRHITFVTAMMTHGYTIASIVAFVCFYHPLMSLQKAAEAKENAPEKGETPEHLGGNYWLARFWAFWAGFVGILPYFTVSVGAPILIVRVLGVADGSITALLIVAVVNTFIGFLMILLATYVPILQRKDEKTNEFKALMLGFGGYISGTGWISLLNESVKMALDGYAGPKIYRELSACLLYICLNALILPVYVLYMRPIVLRAIDEAAKDSK